MISREWGREGSPWEFNLRDLSRWCDLIRQRCRESEVKVSTTTTPATTVFEPVEFGHLPLPVGIANTSSDVATTTASTTSTNGENHPADCAYVVYGMRLRNKEDRLKFRSLLTSGLIIVIVNNCIL